MDKRTSRINWEKDERIKRTLSSITWIKKYLDSEKKDERKIKRRKRRKKRKNQVFH
jgi:hypothetical protein